DLASAVDWVAAHGFDGIVLAGTCSGAHHAFHVAVADRRIGGLVLVNILCFVWGRSYAVGLSAWKHARIARADVAAASAGWSARLL
ncbi:hypothetical protein KC220_25235, partial [Mycobacterium tuberculosis]|nr:hypothetical protein [Mycobacterium tuberculosis]